MAGVGRFVVGLLDDIRIVDSPELTRYIREYLAANAPQAGEEGESIFRTIS